MPYTSELPDTLIIDGQDLQLLTGVAFTDLGFLFAPGQRRGSNDVVPGRRGQIGVPKPLDAFQFSVPVVILPTDISGSYADGAQPQRAQAIVNYEALLQACSGTNGMVTMGRRLATSSSYIEYTAAGEFVQAANVQWLAQGSRVTAELQFINLDGAWRRNSDGLLCWP